VRQYQTRPGTGCVIIAVTEVIFSDSQRLIVVLVIPFFGTERVKTPIDLYEYQNCLWNVRSEEYKNVGKKKNAKEEVGEILAVHLWPVLLLPILNSTVG